MKYIGATKYRYRKYQLIGFLISLFMVFIRYGSYGLYDYKELTPQIVSKGRWSSVINAIFNATGHYLFIIGVILVFIPVFIGKLTWIRDIFSAQIFRPIARINFTMATFSGLGMQLVFFTQY